MHMRKFKLISHHFALFIWLSAVGLLGCGLMEATVGGAPFYRFLGFFALIWAIWASFPPKDE